MHEHHARWSRSSREVEDKILPDGVDRREHGPSRTPILAKRQHVAGRIERSTTWSNIAVTLCCRWSRLAARVTRSVRLAMDAAQHI
jgi:hypothetical protein